MEENGKIIDLLLVKAVDYGKTTLELTKLKTVYKASDVLSTLGPHSLTLLLIYLFILFAGVGLAFWLGDLLEERYLGFLLVAGFYLVLGIVVHFFLYGPIKTWLRNYIIKHMLK